MFARVSLRMGAVCTALLVQACSYQATDNPLVRKFSWFSYLNGDDIRASCHKDGPDRMRFAYNGVYQEQIRTYDIVEGEASHTLKVNVANKADLREWTVGGAGDLLTPWRGQIETVIIGNQDRDLLVRTAHADGVEAGAPEGLQLSSDGFYWIAVSCRSGAVSFNAYAWPSASFANLQFPKLLLAWDPTGKVINPPRETSNIELYGEESPKRQMTFHLKVGRNGLKNVKPLF